jgi:hypothetical protein
MIESALGWPVFCLNWVSGGHGVIRGLARLGALATAGALALALMSGTASARTRYSGHVDGVASGRGHSFVVGAGLNLVFRDSAHARTRYRVCWTDGRHKHCWNGRTKAEGANSTIFVTAPTYVGTYHVTWTVSKRKVARWSFENGLGD